MSEVSHRRPVGLALLLVVGGAVGFAAAFALTVERFRVLMDPDASLSCDFSVIVQCGANLSSPQGALFGFPNPLLGLGAFPAAIVVGAAILAGARFARWFWLLFWVGVTTGLGFVCWLVGQSILVIGTLCPWCMVVWSVMIPMFLALTLHVLRTGILPAPRPVRRAAAALYGWVPFLTLLGYLVIAVLAQLRLDVLGSL